MLLLIQSQFAAHVQQLSAPTEKPIYLILSFKIRKSVHHWKHMKDKHEGHAKPPAVFRVQDVCNNCNKAVYEAGLL